MRVAQVSDFHFTKITWNPFRLFSKRFFGNFNWLLTRKGLFGEKQLAQLPDLFSALKVDLVLLGGDFTTTSLKEEFELAAEFVGKIRQPWIAIPGNHDQYTYKSHREKHFYRFLSNKTEHLFSLAKEGLEVHKIAPDWWIIAFDTALATNPYSSEGLFSKELEERISDALKYIPEKDAIILFSHYPFFQNDVPRRNLKRGHALETLLKCDARIRLYLHGHTHRHTIADLQPNSLPVILDSGSSADVNRGSWNLIDFDEKGCCVTAYGWKENWQPLRCEKITWKNSRSF